MVNIIATAESIHQAEALLNAGVDTLYVGGRPFGLRLPKDLSLEEIGRIAELAHEQKRKVTVAVNGLMHNEQIEQLPDYLKKLKKIKIDAMTVGDPGAILTLKELDLDIPFIYDAQTLVTSAEQIAFWVKRGAVGAVAARELTLTELIEIQNQLNVPIEVQVYGPTCIHQSKRPLVTNYYHYAELPESSDKERGLYLRDPKDTGSQYPIYEDENGTHIFSTEDLSLMPYLSELYNNNLHTWKLDGVLLAGQPFVEIAALFVKAKEALEAGHFVPAAFDNRLKDLQPATRPLGTGFYLKNPDDVK